MSSKNRSMAAWCALCLATVIPASSQRTKTSSPPPPPPAHPRARVAPTTTSRSASGGGQRGGQPTRIIQEYRPPVRPGIAPVNQAIRPSARAASPHDSIRMVGELNVARSRMTGINRSPLPVGQISYSRRGLPVISTADHRQYEVRPDGSIAGFWHGSTTAMYRRDGTPWLIHSGGMSIVRGTQGEELFETRLPSGARVVGWGNGQGYIERPLARGNGTYAQRTYVMGGRRVTAVFRSYSENGRTVEKYVPAQKYPPAFYTWVARRWPQHAHYRWPWIREPWAAPYRLHFEREYPSFADWLADYVFAGMLEMQYENGNQYTESEGSFYSGDSGSEDANSGLPMNGYQAEAAPDPVDPRTTSAIENQFSEYEPGLNAENTEQNPIWATNSAATLQPTAPEFPSSTSTMRSCPPPITLQKIYLVDRPLPIHMDQLSCTLTIGQTIAPDAPNPCSSVVMATVVTSDHSVTDQCAPRSRVQVALSQLQEMADFFPVTMYAGLRVACDSLGGAGDSGGSPCPAKKNPNGQPNPALTADAPAVIAQQQDRAATVQREVTADTTSSTANAANP